MEKNTYLLAVDQGTSGTMVALLDTRAHMVDAVDIPVSVSTPRYGFVEQDPQELIRSIREGAQRLMAAHPDKLDALLGVGMANQGESFLLWNWETGQPVTPVISWQDGRCEALCEELAEAGRDGWFHARTGLHLSSEWPALKLRWLREHDAALTRLWDAGQLAYGQLDAWFLYVLTGGQSYASDHSTACRSGLYNLHTLAWDEELIAGFQAGGLRLPTLCDNTARFEGVDLGIGRVLPWVAGGLDQSMALLGQRCIAPHTAKVTYGTCCACWMNLGGQAVLDSHLTTSVAWKAGPQPVYALAAEGGAAGSIVTWLQRNFRPDWKTSQLSELAESCGEDSQLLFVPAFNGLGAPYWDTAARGTLFGVTAGTAPAHILRAGLDAVAYTVKDILGAMPSCGTLVADGGMCANDYLMQKQADVLGQPVLCPENREGTITGVGYLMCLSLGLFQSLEEIPRSAGDREILPQRSDMEAYSRWRRAVEATIRFYKQR